MRNDDTEAVPAQAIGQDLLGVAIGEKEAQRAPRLMATAYEVEDGLIEGLESPEHSWVIGLQCHPERQDEVPKMFDNLFIGLHERAESFISEFAA